MDLKKIEEINIKAAEREDYHSHRYTYFWGDIATAMIARTLQSESEKEIEILTEKHDFIRLTARMVKITDGARTMDGVTVVVREREDMVYLLSCEVVRDTLSVAKYPFEWLHVLSADGRSSALYHRDMREHVLIKCECGDGREGIDITGLEWKY